MRGHACRALLLYTCPVFTSFFIRGFMSIKIMLAGVAEKAIYRAYRSSLSAGGKDVSDIDTDASEGLLELSDNPYSGTKVWLAIYNDMVAGHVVVEDVCSTGDSTDLSITELNFRINNKAVANHLLAQAIDWARSRKIKNVDITVRTRELRKKSLLANNGFIRRIGYYNTKCVYTYKLQD